MPDAFRLSDGIGIFWELDSCPMPSGFPTASEYSRQPARWFSPTGSSSGIIRLQIPGMTFSQRGWNGQPSGRLKGCGIDPLMIGSLTCGAEFTLGIERRRAWVYGCLGARKMSFTVACSITRPRYITTT